MFDLGCLVLAFPIAILMTGCGRQSLYFGTKTVLGTEISGTTTAPSNFTLGYERSEVALIPRKASGETHSVFGGLDYDIGPVLGGSTVLKQTFATGNAALEALKQRTGSNNDSAAASESQTERSPGANQDSRIFFGTSTKIALNIDFGQSLGQSVPSFLFGFRRGEGTIIPIKDATQEVNSVYADLTLVIDRNGAVRTAPKKSDGTSVTERDRVPPEKLPHSSNGLRITQRFATGRAALLVAGSNEGSNNLKQAAGLALADVGDSNRRIDEIEEQLDTLTNEEQRTLLRTLIDANVLTQGTDWTRFRQNLGAIMDHPVHRDILVKAVKDRETQP